MNEFCFERKAARWAESSVGFMGRKNSVIPQNIATLVFVKEAFKLILFQCFCAFEFLEVVLDHVDSVYRQLLSCRRIFFSVTVHLVTVF